MCQSLALAHPYIITALAVELIFARSLYLRFRSLWP